MGGNLLCKLHGNTLECKIFQSEFLLREAQKFVLKTGGREGCNTCSREGLLHCCSSMFLTVRLTFHVTSRRQRTWQYRLYSYNLFWITLGVRNISLTWVVFWTQEYHLMDAYKPTILLEKNDSRKWPERECSRGNFIHCVIYSKEAEQGNGSRDLWNTADVTKIVN